MRKLIRLTWNNAAGATKYEVWRRWGSSSYSLMANNAQSGWVDPSGIAGRTYVYKIRAVDADGGSTSADSNPDLASLIDFMPIVVRSTTISASHWQQVHDTLNALRAAKGDSALSWTQILPAGVPAPAPGVRVRRAHVEALRQQFTSERGTKWPEDMKFTGHERDFSGGITSNNRNQLDYMHARYYAPVWGRFLSVDPVLDVRRAIRQPEAWNRYSYVVNDPINRIDPDGRVDQNWDGGMAAQLFPRDRRAQLEWEQEVAKQTAIGAASSLAMMSGPGALRVAFTTFPRLFVSMMGVGAGMTGACERPGRKPRQRRSADSGLDQC